MRRVYVVLLNYKNWQDLQECLQSLFRSDYKEFCAIVIDNHSEDDSIERLTEWAAAECSIEEGKMQYHSFTEEECRNEMRPSQWPSLVFISNEDNHGFAAGINPVLKVLEREDAYIWLLNPDTVVEPSALSALVSYAYDAPARSIIGAVIKFYHRPTLIEAYGGGHIQFQSATVKMAAGKKMASDLDYISGSSLFTHAHSFAELGLLPERYFLYWEETDWCYTAKLRGYQLLVCDAAVCYDKVSTSIGRGFLSDFYYTRNGLLFLARHRKEQLGTALLLCAFRFLKKILAGQPSRAKGVYKGVLSFVKLRRHEN